MPRLGGDVDAMERLQGQLKQKGSEIQRLQGELTNMVGNTWWEGPAAERFRNEWNGQYKGSLQKLEALLGDLGQEVQKRKDALVQVSQ